MVMLKVRLVADTGYAIGQTNDGGVRLMDWAVGKGMNLMNHCFWKNTVESKCNSSKDWVKLKTSLLDIAREVCDQTKGKSRHSKTW